jgi:hypothetical protein
MTWYSAVDQEASHDGWVGEMVVECNTLFVLIWKVSPVGDLFALVLRNGREPSYEPFLAEMSTQNTSTKAWY